MIITYTWKQEVAPADPKERTIVASETVTEKREQVFTVSQKLNEFENAKQAVLNAQKKVKDLEAEILAIKTALVIK